MEERLEVFHAQVVVFVRRLDRADNVDDEQDDDNVCC